MNCGQSFNFFSINRSTDSAIIINMRMIIAYKDKPKDGKGHLSPDSIQYSLVLNKSKINPNIIIDDILRTNLEKEIIL